MINRVVAVLLCVALLGMTAIPSAALADRLLYQYPTIQVWFESAESIENEFRKWVFERTKNYLAFEMSDVHQKYYYEASNLKYVFDLANPLDFSDADEDMPYRTRGNSAEYANDLRKTILYICGTTIRNKSEEFTLSQWDWDDFRPGLVLDTNTGKWIVDDKGALVTDAENKVLQARIDILNAEAAKSFADVFTGVVGGIYVPDSSETIGNIEGIIGSILTNVYKEYATLRLENELMSLGNMFRDSIHADIAIACQNVNNYIMDAMIQIVHQLEEKGKFRTVDEGIMLETMKEFLDTVNDCVKYQDAKQTKEQELRIERLVNNLLGSEPVLHAQKEIVANSIVAGLRAGLVEWLKQLISGETKMYPVHQKILLQMAPQIIDAELAGLQSEINTLADGVQFDENNNLTPESMKNITNGIFEILGFNSETRNNALENIAKEIIKIGSSEYVGAHDFGKTEAEEFFEGINDELEENIEWDIKNIKFYDDYLEECEKEFPDLAVELKRQRQYYVDKFNRDEYNKKAANSLKYDEKIQNEINEQRKQMREENAGIVGAIVTAGLDVLFALPEFKDVTDGIVDALQREGLYSYYANIMYRTYQMAEQARHKVRTFLLNSDEETKSGLSGDKRYIEVQSSLKDIVNSKDWQSEIDKKSYYWRVDEDDAVNDYLNDVLETRIKNWIFSVELDVLKDYVNQMLNVIATDIVGHGYYSMLSASYYMILTPEYRDQIWDQVCNELKMAFDNMEGFGGTGFAVAGAASFAPVYLLVGLTYGSMPSYFEYVVDHSRINSWVDEETCSQISRNLAKWYNEFLMPDRYQVLFN